MPITQVKESCLYITNLESCKAFYHQVLGFDIISMKAGRHIFFRAGSSVLLCFIAEATKNEKVLPPHYASGKQHIAFEVPAQEYENWKQKIAGAGIAITHCQQWKDKLESFYFEDPEGHVLEIVPPGIWE